MAYFDGSRYKKNGRVIFEDKISEDGKLRKNTTFQQALYSDGSDAYANIKDTVLSFRNVRNNKNVFFKAFITAFNETYTPNFNATEVFGRTDPIQQYKNTTRNITLAWKLPASSESEAYENLGKVQELLKMLYPTYLSENALTLSQAPLVRLKVMNLLQKNKSEPIPAYQTTNPENLYNDYMGISGAQNGLLGVITSCTVNHNLEGPEGVFEKEQIGTILPKLIDINISFTPLHEQTLGYGTSDSMDYFPYGVELFGGEQSDGRNYVGGGAGKEIKRKDLETQPGQTLTELREAAKTLEEKRRNAAAAQQNADKQAASARRSQRKLQRRGDKMSEERSGRLKMNVAVHEASQMDADRAAGEVKQVESLIGSNSTY